MSIPYEETGRRNQKARTRAALVDAARELLQQGVTPAVEDAASAASVSRATAFRYFPNQRSLLVAAHPEVDVTSFVDDGSPLEPDARLDAVVTGTMDVFYRAPAAYRSMLRLSLEPAPEDRGDLPLRRGLRMVWIEDALRPLRDQLSDEAFRRLVHAVAAVIGIEAIVALEDLAGLDRDEVVEVIRWSAQALLRSALADADP